MFVSLDGTDFQILEPTPFNKKWYSHKFNGPALRYEIGLCIQSGDIVWANGGVPAGDFSYLKLARLAYVDAVDEDEMTLADKGYKDLNFFVTPIFSDAMNLRQKMIMARHETVNMRLKIFGVLRNKFRHQYNIYIQSVLMRF